MVANYRPSPVTLEPPFSAPPPPPIFVLTFAFSIVTQKRKNEEKKRRFFAALPLPFITLNTKWGRPGNKAI